MLNIGCHLSSSKGYVNMLNETEYVGGNICHDIRRDLGIGLHRKAVAFFHFFTQCSQKTINIFPVACHTGGVQLVSQALSGPYKVHSLLSQQGDTSLGNTGIQRGKIIHHIHCNAPYRIIQNRNGIHIHGQVIVNVQPV